MGYIPYPGAWASQVVLVVKNLPTNAGDSRDLGSIPGFGRSPGVGSATHSSILAWKIPWTEEPGELQSWGCKEADMTDQQNMYAAAAAKSLQSCPTLCDPIDSSPPSSPVPGILHARTLEWVAISFSNA